MTKAAPHSMNVLVPLNFTLGDEQNKTKPVMIVLCILFNHNLGTSHEESEVVYLLPLQASCLPTLISRDPKRRAGEDSGPAQRRWCGTAVPGRQKGPLLGTQRQRLLPGKHPCLVKDPKRFAAFGFPLSFDGA